MEGLAQHNDRILLVEDNPGDLLLIEELLLEQMSAPVIHQAPTFAAAKNLLAAGADHYQVILLDLSLPDHTGEALIRDMMALCGDAPVIVLTGYTDFAFGVRSLGLGVADYILKDQLNALSLYKSIVYSLERKRIHSALERSEQRARSFVGQLNKAVEDERARMAREIHDEFGQQLSGLKMSLAALKRVKETELVARVDQLLTDLDGSIATVRRLAAELRPALIDQLGLYAALEWLARSFEKRTGISTLFAIDKDQPQVSQDCAINVFRICQEALTNIARHAQASLAGLEIRSSPEQLIIRITDDGIGLDDCGASSPLSMGLLNMRERATLIGAQLRIGPNTTGGTVIELIIPEYAQKDIDR